DAENGDLVTVREYCPMQSCERQGIDLEIDPDTVAGARFRVGLEEFTQIASSLGQVPHMEPVMASFQENGTCYMVSHKSIGKRLFEAAPLLTATYAQSLGIMLCDTFSALHRNGIYFGTLCEDDLRFNEQGQLRVGTDHLSLEGSAEHDMRGLTAFLMSLLPIERHEAAGTANLDKLLRASYHDAESLKAALTGRTVTRKPISAGKIRGMVRLAMCIVCLAGAVFGVKQLLSHREPLTRALKKGKIQPEVISVWLPLRDHADEQATLAMYQKLAAGFERKNPDCGVNIKIYADGSFEDALALVEHGAEPPAVFMDTQDEIVLRHAADLTPLTSAMRDVYIADLSGFGNSLPLGCSIPALYYNVYADNDFGTRKGTIDFASLPAETLYDASAAEFLGTQSAAQVPSEQFTEFLMNAQTPVLASSSCMAEAEHSGITSGAVQMMPVSVNGTFPVQYEMYCSISDGVSENARNIGMLWLQYLLTEEAQQIMFVENYGDLPLHESAFRSAVHVHSGMRSISDLPLDSLSLQVRR
ncbi:MAG: hypothetical protein II916_04810, partial [Oscillospiraceae bacterium]|nr:hypothetical protein [Oscillospiraceae bacterium]